MSSYALVPIVLGVIGLLAALIVYRAVLSFPEGTGKVSDIANQIHRGALVFMRREYAYLIIFVVLVSVAILMTELGWRTTVSFLVGAFSSAIAGFIGMYTATKANVRTTTAAKERGAEQEAVARSVKGPTGPFGLVVTRRQRLG